MTPVALVLGLQLLFPLVAAARGAAPRAVVADAGTVVAALALSTVFLAADRQFGTGRAGEPGWQPVFALTAAALGAAASGFVLRDRTGAVALAPASFLVLMALRGHRIHEAEILFVVFAVFSAAMVWAAVSRALKGAYFLAARILTVLLDGVLSHDITASPTAVSLTFAVVLLGQHGIRWAARHPLQEIPYKRRSG